MLPAPEMLAVLGEAGVELCELDQCAYHLRPPDYIRPFEVTEGEHVKIPNKHTSHFTDTIEDSNFIGIKGFAGLFGASGGKDVSGVKDVSGDVGLIVPEDVSGVKYVSVDLKASRSPKRRRAGSINLRVEKANSHYHKLAWSQVRIKPKV
jgi:hypothetical protein